MPSLKIVRKRDIDTLTTIRAPGYGYSGEFANIRISRVPAGDDLPETIRRALLGVSVETWGTDIEMIEMCGKDLSTIVPSGSRLAFITMIRSALNQAGKTEEADMLKEIADDFSDMVALPEDCFQIV
ncbi:MAG TPA: hypothetical protein VI752_01975 [Candidatus Paceibacterota bacterium]